MGSITLLPRGQGLVEPIQPLCKSMRKIVNGLQKFDPVHHLCRRSLQVADMLLRCYLRLLHRRPNSKRPPAGLTG